MAAAATSPDDADITSITHSCPAPVPLPPTSTPNLSHAPPSRPPGLPHPPPYKQGVADPAVQPDKAVDPAVQPDQAVDAPVPATQTSRTPDGQPDETGTAPGATPLPPTRPKRHLAIKSNVTFNETRPTVASKANADRGIDGDGKSAEEASNDNPKEPEPEKGLPEGQTKALRGGRGRGRGRGSGRGNGRGRVAASKPALDQSEGGATATPQPQPKPNPRKRKAADEAPVLSPKRSRVRKQTKFADGTVFVNARD